MGGVGEKSSGRSGREVSERSGREVSGRSGREVSGRSGREVSGRRGGREVSGRRGGREVSGRSGREVSGRRGGREVWEEGGVGGGERRVSGRRGNPPENIVWMYSCTSNAKTGLLPPSPPPNHLHVLVPCPDPFYSCRWITLLLSEIHSSDVIHPLTYM